MTKYKKIRFEASKNISSLNLLVKHVNKHNKEC